MEYLAQPQATLVDLLDRILDRGLLLNADIIISLAGVPLIGLNLRAALAGIDTMMKYGLLQEPEMSREVEPRRTFQPAQALLGERVASAMGAGSTR